jgi:hypothetical protein
MAHYAYIDSNKIVTNVIVGKDEESNFDWEQYYGALRTSYNTCAGVHALGGVAFRKNYAGIGYTYDSERDAFIPPKQYASWTLDEESCTWNPPVPRPDGDWYWDEETISWKEITNDHN